MIKILLIRHALTDQTGYIISGREKGISLNDTGRKQAQLLSEKLREEPLAGIFSSPLERAVQTAAPIAESHNLRCNISDNFLEIDYGKWSGRTVSSLKEDPRFRVFNSFRSGTRIPDGETMQEAQLRMIRGISGFREKYREAALVIVSHADMIRSAIAWYAGINLDMMLRIEISPASVSIIEIYDDSAKVSLVNQISK